jgi:pyruvate formate lyase activating enzyme
MKSALYYKIEGEAVRCLLCPHACLITDGRTGRCRVRQNLNNILGSLNYGEISSMALDPIEKKPLYHFYPGRTILSVGTWGCNFHCQFCQNWAIAHGNPQVVFTEPEELAQLATQQGGDCIGVAYTYSEPTVWFEYVKDSAVAVRKAGLKNVLVTNGFINAEPLQALLPTIDAMNIDVKSFCPEFYQEVCNGGLDAVKQTVGIASRHCHVEVTTLLIPGLNDSDEEINRLIRWLATIDPEIPLHFSRYFPCYRMNRQPTPLETLMRARELALPFIHHVHIGNV